MGRSKFTELDEMLKKTRTNVTHEMFGNSLREMSIATLKNLEVHKLNLTELLKISTARALSEK